MIKLTKPQMELLKTSVNSDDGYLDCAIEYTPAKKLVALGLAEEVHFGLSDHVKITKAGVEWLEKHDPDLVSEFCRELLNAGR